MQWNNLKSNECPECGSFLKVPDKQGYIVCEQSNGFCEFTIREERMKEIVDDMEMDAEFKSQRNYE